jgi:hypothetical protein
MEVDSNVAQTSSPTELERTLVVAQAFGPIELKGTLGVASNFSAKALLMLPKII